MKTTCIFITMILLSFNLISQNDSIKSEKNELLLTVEKYNNDSTTSSENIDTSMIGVSEPEWSGDVVYINNKKALKMETQKAFIKASANASMYIVGLGKVKSKMTVKGNKSPFRISKHKNLTFIVNAGFNSTNPQKTIMIIKLENTKKNRYYVGSSVASFSGAKTGDIETIQFYGEKFGMKSYKITIPEIETGEYAIIINSSYDWSLFGID